MDVNYILAFEQNVTSFLKNKGITIHHWINPRIIILVQLYEIYPKQMRQSRFIDVLHDRETISRAVKHLNELDFIKTGKCKSKAGTANTLTITDKGREFIDWIDPDN